MVVVTVLSKYMFNYFEKSSQELLAILQSLYTQMKPVKTKSMEIV